MHFLWTLSSSYIWELRFSFPLPFSFATYTHFHISLLHSLGFILKVKKLAYLRGQAKIKAAQEVSSPGRHLANHKTEGWVLGAYCVRTLDPRWELIQKPQKGLLAGTFRQSKKRDSPISLWVDSCWWQWGNPELKSQRPWGSPELLYWSLCTLFLGHLLCFSIIWFLKVTLTSQDHGHIHDRPHIGAAQNLPRIPPQMARTVGYPSDATHWGNVSAVLISEGSWAEPVLTEPLFSCNIGISEAELWMFLFCIGSPAWSSNRAMIGGCPVQSATDAASQMQLCILLFLLPFLFSMIPGKPRCFWRTNF